MSEHLETIEELREIAEGLIAENKRLLETRNEYAGVIARQRATIRRQAILIGTIPRSQLNLHGDPLSRGKGEEPCE